MSQRAPDGLADGPGGRPLSVEELVRSQARLAYLVAMDILKDHQLAEDAVQETFVRVARALDRGLRPDFPGPFIRSIARHEALRIARRPRHAPLVREPVVPASRSPAEAAEDRRRIADALRRLPPDQALLLSEIYFDGVPRKEVQRRLGITRSGLSRRLARAREAFRWKYGDENPVGKGDET